MLNCLHTYLLHSAHKPFSQNNMINPLKPTNPRLHFLRLNAGRTMLGCIAVDAHGLLREGLSSHLTRRIATCCARVLTFSQTGPALLWEGFRAPRGGFAAAGITGVQWGATVKRM